jgi:hypothetical protein
MRIPLVIFLVFLELMSRIRSLFNIRSTLIHISSSCSKRLARFMKLYSFNYAFLLFSTAQQLPSVPGPSRYRGFTITLRHAALGRAPLDEWSARCRNLHLTTFITQKRQTAMSPVGFEPATPASERPQTCGLERAVNARSKAVSYRKYKYQQVFWPNGSV